MATLAKLFVEMGGSQGQGGEQEDALHENGATKPTLKRWSCPSCGAWLASLYLPKGGIVEIKCYRCNQFATKEAV